MQINTGVLEGEALEYAIQIALGHSRIPAGTFGDTLTPKDISRLADLAYMETEWISHLKKWGAVCNKWYGYGEYIETAIGRAFVLSQMGDRVDVPVPIFGEEWTPGYE